MNNLDVLCDSNCNESEKKAWWIMKILQVPELSKWNNQKLKSQVWKRIEKKRLGNLRSAFGTVWQRKQDSKFSWESCTCVQHLQTVPMSWLWRRLPFWAVTCFLGERCVFSLTPTHHERLHVASKLQPEPKTGSLSKIADRPWRQHDFTQEQTQQTDIKRPRRHREAPSLVKLVTMRSGASGTLWVHRRPLELVH